MIHAVIRQLVADHGRLPIAASAVRDGDDLYTAGLTSFAAVQLMLAIEERFGVEFPERMLNRRCFGSIGAIAGCLREIGADEVGTAVGAA